MHFARIVVSAMLVGWTVVAVAARDQQPQSPAPKTQITYAAFMALNDQQRRERFDAYDADTKSGLMRTHANQWLDKNRTRLSASQIAVMQEVIAYLSPETYRNPGDAQIARRGQELTEKLKCQLRHSDVLAAIGPHRSPSSASWMNDVWFWFNQCVIG
jgi:hypothetical protein